MIDGVYKVVSSRPPSCSVVDGDVTGVRLNGGGEMAIFDLRQRRLREKWTAHSMAVQALALAADRSCFSTSADADVKLCSVDAPCAPPPDDAEATTCAEGQPRGRWDKAHEHTMLAPLVGTKLGARSGVTALTLLPPFTSPLPVWGAGDLARGAVRKAGVLGHQRVLRVKFSEGHRR